MSYSAAYEASEGQTAINMLPSAATLAMEVTLPYLHEAGISGRENIS
jgi:hypothetical protein